MSKSIYEEALLELECLDIDMHDVMQEYIGNYDYDLIHKALEQARKQEKLLELYEALVIVKNDMLSYCEVVDNDYYDSKELATSFEKQIKELENE